MPSFDELQFSYWQKSIHKKRRIPSNPIIKVYVEPKLDYVSKFIPLNKDTKVLDVGAGNGYFSYYFDKVADVTAVDFSEVILGQNPVQKKYVMDARDLKFPDQSFDLVFCHALLHHIDKSERSRVINEMRRVSKRNVVIIEPNRNNPLMALFGLLKKEERGTMDFSMSHLVDLFKSANLEIIKASSFGLLTPNRMPIPKLLLPLEMRLFERPLWNGISNILIARR